MKPFTEQEFHDLHTRVRERVSRERVSRKAREEWKESASEALRNFANAPTTRYEDVSGSHEALSSVKNAADRAAWDFHEDTEPLYVKVLSALSTIEARLL